MSTILILMAGVMIAAFIFAATLWSATQSIRTRGLQQYAHIGCAILVTAAMAALSFEAALPARFIGFLLVFAGILAIYEDARWSKLLPLVHVLFGLVLISGLPFMTAA